MINLTLVIISVCIEVGIICEQHLQQWRRKYFRKEGAEKIRRKAPKKFFIAPLGNFAGGQISVWALCIGNGT